METELLTRKELLTRAQNKSTADKLKRIKALTEQRDAARDALRWALDQIEDDLDPDHQAALAHARSLLED